MSVGKKNDGRWYCAYRDTAHSGKIVYEYFGHTDAARTDATERDLQIKLLKNRRQAPVNEVGVITFEELAQIYIDARNIELSPKTVEGILYAVNFHALPVIGSHLITRITMNHWSAIEKTMIARKLSARSINKYFQYLSLIFKWAVDRDYLQNFPWTKRKPLRIKNKFQVDLLTPAEFQRIVEAADDHLRWALEVEINTGVRPGVTELFALKWDDFDHVTGAVRIYSSKTDSYHTQFVSDEFLQRLQTRRAAIRADDRRLVKRRGELRPECPFVISFRGHAVRQLANAWATAKKKAGITRRIRLYDIRHFFITHALAGGADLLDLANRVGHKDANMIVTVYAHLVEEMKTKKPFSIPEIDVIFPAQNTSSDKMLAKNVSQSKNVNHGHSSNNVLLFSKNGRGGVI